MHKIRHALATWNVGGLQARRVLQLCDELKGTSSLRDAHLLLVQEVVCEPGVQYASEHDIDSRRRRTHEGASSD